MKKYSQEIARNLGVLVLTHTVLLVLTYLTGKLGRFQSPLKIILEIAWFIIFMYVTNNIQQSLYQKNKHRVGVNWGFRALLISYSFSLILAELTLLVWFLLTPSDDITRLTIVIAAFGGFLGYVFIMVMSYFESRKGLKGMSKEEVFE